MRFDVDIFFVTFGAIALYYLVMFLWSFKKVEACEPDLGSLGFVIFVPALNEAVVIDDTCKQMKRLGSSPWSRALTEDIDLGMALTGQGQRICFTGKTAVVQHGLTSLRRLLKQRSRWVQGHWPWASTSPIFPNINS